MANDPKGSSEDFPAKGEGPALKDEASTLDPQTGDISTEDGDAGDGSADIKVTDNPDGPER